MKDTIRKTIFEDVAQGNSYQKTITKLRKLPLEPVANGRLSPDVRARMIARTERARARGFGTLQAYANYGVEYYDLIPRSKGACNICLDLADGNPYKLTDSTAYIPIHPNCICTIRAHIPEGETLSSTPVDFPISIADYVDLTMQKRI
jgi:SPP1 gp7 family putative phage head morphogenesis protein